MENTTKIITAWELYNQNIPQLHIADHLGKNRDTIRLWVKGIKAEGLNKFLANYENAKKSERAKRQLDPILKRRIWEIREREEQCCGEKIQYFLKKDYGLKIATSTIYIALKEKYKLRSKWMKNKARGFTPKALKPREVIQMDSVNFGQIFAFTGIDIFTREVDVYMAPQLTAQYGFKFLERSMDRIFKRTETLQTDGGSEFKDQFKQRVLTYCDRHRIARPYKKNEQAYIESFNRTLRKECLGWNKYSQEDIQKCQSRVESFLYKYHNYRPHMGLQMRTPNELLN